MNRTLRTRELPGPTGWRLVGTFASLLQGDLLKPFVRLFEQYGPLFRLPLPLGHDLVMLAHPDAVEQVLRSGQGNYPKGSVYDGARLLLGDGLVTSEGELWRRQRTLANPAFRPANMQFSLLEARLVLSLILRRFKVESLAEPEIGCVAAGTLRPDQTIRPRRK